MVTAGVPPMAARMWRGPRDCVEDVCRGPDSPGLGASGGVWRPVLWRPMRIGVLGTGMVGQTLATKLVELGHEVLMGSREAGNEKAVAWVGSVTGAASEGSFEDAAAFGELVINATAGTGSLEALEQAGGDGGKHLAGKVLVDVANPLDFSGGTPRLAVCNDDSLGEQIQRAFPEARVVKALNTVTASVMVTPDSLGGESSNLFVCGDDGDAKAAVIELLETFGWLSGDIVDLGDIGAARGTEMYLPIWLRIMGAVGGPQFNIKIVKAQGS
jgi:8-hydroxy-5-deazaflavin:NADPH oxidoreductase